ncbi:hypothetical protein C8R14_12511 [Nitrosomonas eutropha]|jgi:hypothetical protein|uniref:Uncharacterized protein n=1 Tax=Nitrosomonas eutropha TaxID=916 RepID=A0ABX5M8D1_9PROT|nr:hypothetical protein C8R14_12511 [Nitrosomonas eutropha]
MLVTFVSYLVILYQNYLIKFVTIINSYHLYLLVPNFIRLSC